MTPWTTASIRGLGYQARVELQFLVDADLQGLPG
jgi:hypothetical protein